MTFEERQKDFESNLLKLVNEFKINIYAANVVFPNGEVLPMIKTSDAEPKEVIKNEDENKLEEKSVANKKA